MIVKSKYDGYGELEVKITGHDYDFIAHIENNTDNFLKLFINDLEGDYSEPIVIRPYDWVGLLADEDGRGKLESIMDGDFKVA